jgi:hypothetical protein
MIQVGLCHPLADRHPASALSHLYYGSACSEGQGKRRRQA